MSVIGGQVPSGMQKEMEAELVKLRQAQRRQFLVAMAVVTVGCMAITAGVAIIFWPASLIVGGFFAVAGGAIFVDIPEPQRRGYQPEDLRSGR